MNFLKDSSLSLALKAMAGIQLRLQKELFAPNDEQLMAMAHCFKATAATTGQGGGTTSAGGGLKRKEIYLCVLNDTSSTHHGNKGGLNIRSGHLLNFFCFLFCKRNHGFVWRANQ